MSITTGQSCTKPHHYEFYRSHFFYNFADMTRLFLDHTLQYHGHVLWSQWLIHNGCICCRPNPENLSQNVLDVCCSSTCIKRESVVCNEGGLWFGDFTRLIRKKFFCQRPTKGNNLDAIAQQDIAIARTTKGKVCHSSSITWYLSSWQNIHAERNVCVREKKGCYL